MAASYQTSTFPMLPGAVPALRRRGADHDRMRERCGSMQQPPRKRRTGKDHSRYASAGGLAARRRSARIFYLYDS